MTSETASESTSRPTDELTRSITGRLLFFYVLGDVLGSGIYVLIGAVAGAVAVEVSGVGVLVLLGQL